MLPTTALASIAPALLCPAAPAQEAGDSPVLQKRIGEAIDRGVGALLSQQEIDGSWRAHQDGYLAGTTALCVYTLLKSGLPSDHPSITRALDYLRLHPSRKTYCVSALIMALCEVDPERHADWIGERVEELCSWQRAGGFSYPDGDVDLSNTQYATLALRAAHENGFDVSSRVWERLVDCAIRHQDEFSEDSEPAGFFYRRDSYTTGSMTTAGITILLVCRERGVKSRSLERSLAAGVAWLEREPSVTENPRRDPPYQYYYYYLYGLERVGGLLGREHLGGRDWYREGAEVLLAKQTAEGRWGGQDETCFALLFLARATAPVSGERSGGVRHYLTEDPAAEVSLVVTGDSPLTLWIDGLGPRARALEWEEDEGRGPRVLEVAYMADEGDDEWTEIARVAGDPSRPVEGERFAAQHTFGRPGKRRVRAIVHVLAPGASVDEPARAIELRSPPLEVSISRAWNEELASYASDPERNVLSGERVRVEASSELVDAHAARRAVDDRQASSWLGAEDDPLPWIRLEPGHPVRASTLLVSHAFDPSDLGGQHASRIHRVALRVNGAKSPIEFEMIPDDWRKTRVSLGRTQRVRVLELRVLEVVDEGTPRRGVGFGEVELQLDR